MTTRVARMSPVSAPYQRRRQTAPAGLFSRYGSLLGVVFLFGISATFILLRYQSDVLNAPIFMNPFGRIEDPYESYSDFSVEIRRDDKREASILSVEASPALFKLNDAQVIPINVVRTPVRSNIIPVLGDPATNGAVPLFNKQHQGGDAVFALACKYPVRYYERFVGSLRQSKFTGDIVLAVSPINKMKTGVEDYIEKTGVIAYGFEVDCKGKDNCKLLDEFLGYPDPRPYRTFANIRYALYEYWLQYYSRTSYILILDFRDTFFQLDPFGLLPPIHQRKPVYDLRMFAENNKVKTLSTCKYNSFWVKKCFSKQAIVPIADKSVICSGSTMGSFDAISYYVKTMLQSMDTVQCWKKGIESDQGYQNYLFYYGHFNAPDGSANATLFQQGEGVVNTVGAMNGFRVPKDKRGPLDTFWKIRDKDGYVLNNDGTKSACIHQWDRFYSELQPFIDKYTFNEMSHDKI